MKRLTEAELKGLQRNAKRTPAGAGGAPQRRVKSHPGVRLSEHEEQVLVVQWAEAQALTESALLNLFAVPNAGKRHPAVGARMRAEGMKKGVPDLFLDVSRGGFHGLRIELKVYPNTLTLDQKDWLKRLNDQDYYAMVCYGAASAIQAIEDYLALGISPVKGTTISPHAKT